MKSRLLCAAVLGSLALAACSTTSPNYGYGSSYPSGGSYPAPQSCLDCGIVTRIDVIGSNRSAPAATGAILGGIVGAVAGHEISDKTGGSKGNQNVSAVAGPPARWPATPSRAASPAIPTTSTCAWTTAAPW